MTDPVIAVSLGAGVQSTTMMLLACEGVLPKPDFGIFSDTGWEGKRVYEHLDALTRWCEMHDIPIYRASKGSLPADVLNPQVYATLPAWTKATRIVQIPTGFTACPMCNGDGGLRLVIEGDEMCEGCQGSGWVAETFIERPATDQVGAILRTCTAKYKIEPLYQTLREKLGARVWDEPCRYCEATGRRVAPWDAAAGVGVCSICRGSGTRRRVGHVPPGTRVEQWIGFSTDEFERATSVGFPSYATPRHPLIDLGWTRRDCENYLHAQGWTAVNKSACSGCPFHDDETWLDLKKNDPEEFAAVVAYDRQFRTAPGLNAERYLHEARIPLDEAVALYQAKKERDGEQLVVSDEFKPRRKVRHCNPFGCKTSEIDEDSTELIA